ncbi:FxsA family protein [Solemya velum gill symbiont]|uniref:Exlusion protein FxsA n=1 Tax=Solemya velum gill symbiont TaxID=2340 RepID=A0A0B0HEL2_SOVGS|nr:FxsA family protein [Solemya velum gill symbiont]KHF26339.1 hypothetical protein JV46_22130 [Solemya velum gill symbiont]OOY35574.1 hypothetical protein BOV88_04860 [Solemya velum gill symbiont]OOY46649.1 hypothetical protein BOV93_09320 [Solemya velum gill symbiont]OOY49479.1 hypothetical protein BOV94_10580 [Solemya velum gill symbiont]OOY51086.1 hypothetical protein BOV97_09005 [Solemya velum gill symbiont]
MPLLFLLFFVAVPATELYIMIEVGSEIGAFATIWLVILTAVIGGWLVRQQGISTIFRMRQQLDQGEAPAFDMLQGILLAVAGISLLLPGFVTDTIGFLLLIPPLRHLLVLRWLKNSQIITPAGEKPDVTIIREEIRYSREGDIIEGEFKRNGQDDSKPQS